MDLSSKFHYKLKTIGRSGDRVKGYLLATISGFMFPDQNTGSNGNK
jgi:hypothetical protein